MSCLIAVIWSILGLALKVIEESRKEKLEVAREIRRGFTKEAHFQLPFNLIEGEEEAEVEEEGKASVKGWKHDQYQ